MPGMGFRLSHDGAGPVRGGRSGPWMVQPEIWMELNAGEETMEPWLLCNSRGRWLFWMGVIERHSLKNPSSELVRGTTPEQEWRYFGPKPQQCSPSHWVPFCLHEKHPVSVGQSYFLLTRSPGPLEWWEDNMEIQEPPPRWELYRAGTRGRLELLTPKNNPFSVGASMPFPIGISGFYGVFFLLATLKEMD